MRWFHRRSIRIWVTAIVVIAFILATVGITVIYYDGEPQPDTTSQSTGKSQTKKANPLWSDLTPDQKEILAPLEPEWNGISAAQKKKWLRIARKLDSLTPEEKQRGQERIREWVKLTPEQRRVARKNFISAQKLNPQKKSEQWQEYQKLPEEKKKELAARGKVKKQVANPSGASQKKTKDADSASSDKSVSSDAPVKKETESRSWWRDEEPIYWR